MISDVLTGFFFEPSLKLDISAENFLLDIFWNSRRYTFNETVCRFIYGWVVVSIFTNP